MCLFRLGLQKGIPSPRACALETRGGKWQERVTLSAARAAALRSGPPVSDRGLGALGAARLEVRIKTSVFCFGIPLGEPKPSLVGMLLAAGRRKPYLREQKGSP